jgi:tRNA threonylcarbamoyladenosine biosynthesis protein TsaB
LAQGAYRAFQAEQVLAAMDARLDEIFCAAYVLDNKAIMRPCDAEQRIDPCQLQSISLNDFVGVGSGWDKYHDILAAPFKKQLRRWYLQRYPSAYDVALIASDAYQCGQFVSAAEALPVYLRETVAVRRGSNG